ncbi:MAG: phospho-N-acetylmuramoyl-pentapeptide-transferase [Fibromonadaceae bacterium]|jgi:phospho-N-acetylmuramoyl-pentapeptide-transferase|nr:phospho-N-acetylmuramoyl-pentapeptide-transferase [Fibromonadaceae bacterium]
MLIQYLFDVTGYQLLDSRLFRAGFAAVLASLLVFLTMPHYIAFLKKIGATSDFKESSPPIMGGLLLVAIVVLVSCVTANFNGYVIPALAILMLYSIVGAVDDLIKIRTKRLVDAGKLAKKSYEEKADGISSTIRLSLYLMFSFFIAILCYKLIPDLTGELYVPFINPKAWSPHLPNWIFILFITFVVASSANGTNFTDGIDSLVSVPLITGMFFVGIVAYVSGNAIFSDYLHIPYLKGCDELFPIAMASIGALLAYLWYNSPPAEIYMGDAGSIGFGALLGIMFILVQAALFLPIIGIIILVEALSVVLQIGHFKLNKRIRGWEYADKHRLFLRAPLHHHFQMKWKGRFGDSKPLVNAKIAWRMHLISFFALIVGFIVFFGIR